MSRRSIVWATGVCAVAIGLSAQQAPNSQQQERQRLAQQDRQRIMDMLGITSIPPGAQSSNPDTYYLAASAAQPAYALLGRKGMPQGANEFPKIGTALIDGEVGFQQHTGGHTDGPTWPTFLTFAERFIGNR